jgi:medium-chain acyl-[acyl-carrier-protein] hydrolase
VSEGAGRWRSWLPVYPEPRPDATRLFCIPHAGAGASIYRSWGDRLLPSVLVSPVQLKGREERFKEWPQTSIVAIASDLASILAERVEGPFVLFGYSMGAIIAWETARTLRRIDGPMPSAIVLAAHRAPHLPLPRKPIWNLPEKEFLAELRDIGGISDEVLACPELMDFVMSALRADFEACETYRCAEEAPLDIPVAVFGGAKDHFVPPDSLEAWSEHSLRPLTLRTLPGGHFFLRENRAQLQEYLAQFVDQIVRARRMAIAASTL